MASRTFLDKLGKDLVEELSTYVDTIKIYDFASRIGISKEEVDKIEKEKAFTRPTLIKNASTGKSSLSQILHMQYQQFNIISVPI